MPILSAPKAAPKAAHKTAPRKALSLNSVQLKRVAPSPENTATTAFGEYRYASSPWRGKNSDDATPFETPSVSPIQRQKNAQKKTNNTGLPDQLKTGIESLAGMSMDHVNVHYNSLQPAKFNAHAYAQGSDIHLAPGQERHLPHEAWHVVQQQQGRVKPTMQTKAKVNINDDTILEKEADVMGKKASQFLSTRPEDNAQSEQQEMRGSNQFLHHNETGSNNFSLSNSFSCPIQRVIHGAPQFVIHTPANLTADATARLQSTVDTLVTTIDNDVNLDVQQLVVSVEAEGGADFNGGHSTIAGDNPAETISVHHFGDHYQTIQITIQRPFAQAATEGEMLGLLAHEIGVHNIPSDFRGINDSAVNAFAPIHTARKTAEDNTVSGGYEFDNWPVPALGHAPANRDGNRQHDHVMVADILRNPPAPGVAPPLTRANLYFETVLNIGDTIWASGKTLAQRQEQTTELIHLYLVDIARIIATDDGRLPPLRHTAALNDIYGEVFTQVVLPQAGAHPWIPAARPKANRFTLGLSLAAFIGKVKLEKSYRG